MGKLSHQENLNVLQKIFNKINCIKAIVHHFKVDIRDYQGLWLILKIIIITLWRRERLSTLLHRGTTGVQKPTLQWWCPMEISAVYIAVLFLLSLLAHWSCQEELSPKEWAMYLRTSELDFLVPFFLPCTSLLTCNILVTSLCLYRQHSDLVKWKSKFGQPTLHTLFYFCSISQVSNLVYENRIES